MDQNYRNSVEHWERLAQGPEDELKLELHRPYENDKDFSPTTLTLLDGDEGYKVLDFGCGVGRNFPFLKGLGYEVHGFDFPKMIERCRELGDPVELLMSDWGECLQHKYDVVFDIFSFQFVVDEGVLRKYLQDISEISNFLYLVTRSYTSLPDHKNILAIINELDLFEVVASGCNTDKFVKVEYPDIDYGEILLQSKKYKRKEQKRTPREADVVFLTDAYKSYSGGRYHDFMTACLLGEIGYKTTFYTDSEPVFVNDFIEYNTPSVITQSTHDIEVPDAKLFFGAVWHSSLSAIRLGIKYNRPVCLMLYDCPTWLQESVLSRSSWYRQYIEGETKNYNRIKKSICESINKLPDLRFLPLTQNSIQDWAQWFNLPEDRFFCINPCINSRMIDNFHFENRKKWIVAISRNFHNKNWRETFEVFSQFSDEYELHIVTDNKKKFSQYCKAYRIDPDRVWVHEGVSDAGKFYILGQASLLISNSLFEGFGMWAIEALAMGVPVVCYDLRSLESINYDGLYKVPCFNKTRFIEEIKYVLTLNKWYHRNSDFSDRVNMDKLKNLTKFLISD